MAKKKKKNFKKGLKKAYKKTKEAIEKYKPHAKRFAKQTVIRYKKFIPYAKRYATAVETGRKQFAVDIREMRGMYQQPQYGGYKIIFLGREGSNIYPSEKIAKSVLVDLYQNYTGSKTKSIPTNIGNVKKV